MIHLSWRKLSAALLFASVASLAGGGTTAAPRPSGLLPAAQSAESAPPAQKDRTQWRNLHRKMSKDEVKKLLGEPVRVSVSRFYEAWDYPGGTVIFDGKGRLDAWSEL
ncbi:MAG: hypothetical protein JOY95_13970 [Silvibacterium sp.]|nr:hypothetical protein [Silvibacterium sp.]